MAADGIEVAEYLMRRLVKKKIIIVATSWGSVLGFEWSKTSRLFYAYVGHSQVVNPSAASFEHSQKLRKAQHRKTGFGQKAHLDRASAVQRCKAAGSYFRLIKIRERNSAPARAPVGKSLRVRQRQRRERPRNGDDYSFQFHRSQKTGDHGYEHRDRSASGCSQFRTACLLDPGPKRHPYPGGCDTKYFEKLRLLSKEFYISSRTQLHGHNHAVVDMQFKVLKTAAQIN